MVNYSTDLQYLFQSTDTRKPYNIDTLLFQLISESGFANIVDITSYLTDVSTVELQRQDANDVGKYVGIVVPGELPVDENFPEPVKTLNFSDNAAADDVYIVINNSSTMNATDFQKMVIELTTTNMNSDLGNMAKDHVLFRNFLFDNMEDIVRYSFNSAKQQLGQIVYNLPESDPRHKLYDPVMRLHSMKISHLGTLLKALRDSCLTSMTDILKLSPTITSHDLTNFKRGAFTSKFYYDLRSRMNNTIVVKHIYTNIDDAQVVYFKKLVVDLYLKSCYPIVHMLYMQSLMEWYATSGDYVNVRVVMLALIYYVFYTLKSVVNMSSSMPPAQQLTTAQNSTFNTIFNQLNVYLANNNKINVNSNTSANEEMKALVIELHDLSRGVSNQNNDIQKLKAAIKENQLIMRNVLFNIEVKRKEYKWTTIEFWCALALVLILTIINAVLLFMNLPQYVYYVSGLLGILITTFLIVKVVISFTKSNK